ncbi:hypothetical protein [Alkalibacillus almallahensis]|uniref:hypothetical protein n=1 Tax=Alkalibacillus almallahensis TaxID=1379154 RepID=UPI00141FB267|nr:hypothetical protein [Alkalibacillus almallahensis]NIK12859.1 hypothetical protein [Alkalibacillus almallahensis]
MPKANQSTTPWNQDTIDRLFELKQSGEGFSEIAQTLSQEYNRRFTEVSVRRKYQRMNKHSQSASKPTKQASQQTSKQQQEPTDYKETVEINQDGTQTSDKLVELSEMDMKDEEAVLKAHGYDPVEWQISKATSSKWHHHNKQDGTKTLYASKVVVKKQREQFDFDKLIDIVTQTPQVTVKPKYINHYSHYLNIPLFDMHFGVSDYEHYKSTQAKILNLLNRQYKEVLLLIGSDLFHHNDHRNRTASTREIEHADMVEAWQDAITFYDPIIKEAIKRSGKVTAMYIKGNHDESLSWGFIKYLEAKYPHLEVDADFRERKVHMLGNNFVGANHGDKKKEKDLAENFATEFAEQWAKASNRDVFVGHLHSEWVLDKGGVMIRRLPTRNKIDQWHDDHGYTTAHKRFQVYEYTENDLETIYYV